VIALSKDFSQIVKNSIAFDINVVERLNKKAVQIDPRLFLFAYYQPKLLPKNSDARMCFYTAVLNMYGLLWDCGKIVQHQLFGLNHINHRPSTIQMLVYMNLKDCEKFFSIILNVRTCICHNNSDYLYFNQVKRYGCKQYLENTAGASITLYSYDESQWERICQDFLDRCKWFVSILDNFLDQILKETDPKRKNIIVKYWIYSISKWYQEDINLITHVLADRYKLKALTSIRNKNTIVTISEVIKWVYLSWKKRNPSLILANKKEYYLNYISSCQAKLSSILDAKDCPKPALPLEVLTKATADARMF